MKLETFSHSLRRGWSRPEFPALDSERTLVLVFGAREYLDTPEAIHELALAYPRSHVVGCSTSGEILGTEVFDGTLAVAVAQFEKTDVATTFATAAESKESRAAGEGIARTLQKPGLRAVLVLSDGINVNGSDLVSGINSVLPPEVLVTGGLAGDADRFQRTWVVHNGKPQPGLIAAVGLYGAALRVGHGSKGGWDIFGPERVVTRSVDNVLYELDSEPALGLYKRYLGERADELPASALLFPLALRESAGSDKWLVRTILAVNEAQQSLTFAGNVPQGWTAQLMKANFDRLVEGASGAAKLTREGVGDGSDVLAVAISCVGRRLVLGERTEEETEATLDVLPPNTKQVGFYSYGEISPFTTGHCDLHNQTMTLTAIAET